MAFSASSHPPIASNEISQIGTSLTDITCDPATAHKWSIDQVHALVSNPSKYYDNLTAYQSFTDEFCVDHEQKLKEVRHVLISKAGGDSLEGLLLIDAIQRLGIDHYFQQEIDTVLQSHNVISKARGHSDHDLYAVALCFRLLRQQGYFVPADVFNNFKDKEGKFKQKLSEDIKGLMGLYEAAQLSTEGEDILDEAGDFSGELLNACMPHLNDHEARVVANTLRYPHHKSLSRFMAKKYLSDFQDTNEWTNVLVELAKMDFNILQSIQRREILEVSKWWKELGLTKELKFARDQPLKWYMWSMAVLTDPSFSEQRIELTKPISLVYIIDDIFDVYGTLDELTLFTEAVSRWEFAAVDQLPDYMKACFKALYDITNEIGYKLYEKHGWNPIDSLRKTWESLCNAFLVEARWFASGQLPKAEEYLRNGVVSSGVHVVLVHMFFLLGQGITKESQDLGNDHIPGIIYFTATILRLWDDLGSAKDENQDGHDGSYVECYMKDNEGSSVESARDHITQMISDSWKCLNKECLSPNPFSASFTRASLNAARMVPLMYNYDDDHSLPSP
ncbi:hypothetical protein L1049_012498 [Liquidambar formosana]|uniref:Uncharacterized protein n=1 Tax=Liquidambar formosana TaxID=63359 RepID=A0AAP0N333_LIQFO